MGEGTEEGERSSARKERFMPHVFRVAARRLVPWAVAALLLVVAGAPAQVLIRVPKDEKPLPIDADGRAKVIQAILRELDEGYVFPDVAKKMRQAVEDRVGRKEYDAVKTGQELAKQLTAHLQEVSKDKHLRVMCHTAKLPAPPKGKKPSEKDLERMRQRFRKSNGGYQRVERLPGNVGYLRVDGFMHPDVAAEPAAAAMNFLANTDALIIDVRHNGGGSPHSVALLCSYLFGEKPVHLNSLYQRKGDRTEDFWTLKEVAGKRYLGKDVYVLTSRRTFSAAEEFAYDLQCLKRATVVGETTGGGAHPGRGVPVGDHFVVFVPSGRAINPVTKTNWEGTGVKPDVAAAADKALETAHRLAVKKLLAAAPDEEARRLIRMDLERAEKLGAKGDKKE
jgi:C-terminal processing protease CtpA/Prc